MNTAVLLLALVAVTVAQDYEVSEVQVKMIAKPKDSAASPTIEQMARVAAARATSQNCCSYPVSRIDVVASPSSAEFMCAEPVTVSCANSREYLETGIAIDGKQKLSPNDILTVGITGPATAQLQCNGTSKTWNFKNYPTEIAKVACVHKTFEGEWTY